MALIIPPRGAVMGSAVGLVRTDTAATMDQTAFLRALNAPAVCKKLILEK